MYTNEENKKRITYKGEKYNKLGENFCWNHSKILKTLSDKHSLNVSMLPFLSWDVAYIYWIAQLQFSHIHTHTY